MTELSFAVLDVTPEPYAASPTLIARLRVEETTGATVHALALRAQVRLEPHRRRYSEAEEAGLLDLFGSRDRWGSTLKPFLWLQCTTLVPGFTGASEVDLPIPCTYDFEVAASKYLHALGDGTVPLLLLFSGTVFTTGTDTRGGGGFAVEQVPWDREASYEMPVQVWRDLVGMHFPGSGWLRLGHETLASLLRYKAAHGLTGLDAAVTELLTTAGAPARTAGEAVS